MKREEFDELIQKYFKNKTTREEERKLLDYCLKSINEMLNDVRKMGTEIVENIGKLSEVKK